MKTLLLFTFLVFLGAQAYAQQDPERMQYLQKVEKYHRMKRTGTTLTLMGSVLSVVGMVTIMNSSYETTYSSYGSPQTTSSRNPEAGIAAYLVGSACVGAGIPLWIVGGVNEGRYQRKLDALTVGASLNRGSAGLTLRYRF
jgi:hypothetical protein